MIQSPQGNFNIDTDNIQWPRGEMPLDPALATWWEQLKESREISIIFQGDFWWINIPNVEIKDPDNQCTDVAKTRPYPLAVQMWPKLGPILWHAQPLRRMRACHAHDKCVWSANESCEYSADVVHILGKMLRICCAQHSQIAKKTSAIRESKRVIYNARTSYPHLTRVRHQRMW
jgi:hypothetical protein